MSHEEDWEIPPQLQPDPDDYRFDLEAALRAVVGVRAAIPADAFTAHALGTERAGSGVVIGADGLVLTIGYLIAEAENVWLITARGAIPGHALAYDQETGFGLVQPLGQLGIAPLALGDPAGVEIGASAILAAGGGRHHAVETRIVARHEFAGYWEYLLEDALFVAPAHPFWGGAGLIGLDGRLLGIGSLVVQQSDAKGRRLDMNMVVPVDRLVPILNDLLRFGRRRTPPRPWLGLFAGENDDAVVVGGVVEGGPADQAGVHVGDRILAVEHEPVTDLASLWRGVWAVGPAGARVRLALLREGEELEVVVTSADRAAFLKAPRLH